MADGLVLVTLSLLFSPASLFKESRIELVRPEPNPMALLCGATQIVREPWLKIGKEKVKREN